MTARPGLFTTLRRALLVVPMVAVLWSAPASAQTYGEVFNNKKTPPPTAVVTSSVSASTDPGGGSGLARTGSNLVVPLGQAAAVMVGTGTLLVLGTRRRRPRRTAS